MRLWYKSLIDVLPKQQLVSQWRELLAIKGSIQKKGTPNHILVNKVLDYSIGAFKRYTKLVYTELLNRNYKPSTAKYDEIISWDSDCFTGTELSYTSWHNDIYLRQCLYNLEEKAMCGGINAEEWENIADKFGNKFELWRG